MKILTLTLLLLLGTFHLDALNNDLLYVWDCCAIPSNGLVNINQINPVNGSLTERDALPVAATFNKIAVDPLGRFLYKVSAQDNSLTGYQINSDGIPVFSFTNTEPGFCPNDFEFDPFGRFIFVNEFCKGDITSYQIDPVTGVLTETGVINRPGGATHILIDRTGRFLYTHDSGLTLFLINQSTGALAFSSAQGLVGTGGDIKWATNPTADFFYFGGTFQPAVTILSVDTTNGNLSVTGSFPLFYIIDLGFDNTGEFLYATSFIDDDYYLSSLAANPTTGALTLTGSMKFKGGVGIADPSNRFYYGQESAPSQKVQRLKIDPINGTLSSPISFGAGVPFNAFRLAEFQIPPSGNASPYFSSRAISGFTGGVAKVRVGLTNIKHTSPDDLDILLVGPQGQSVMLMSDAGGNSSITNVSLNFDDSASSPLPDSTQITSGVFQPTDNEIASSEMPPPAPGGSYDTALSVFENTDPNGIWNLFVTDDVGNEFGAIESWHLSIDLLNDDFEDIIQSWLVQKGSCNESGGSLNCVGNKTTLAFAPSPWSPSGSMSCSVCGFETTISTSGGINSKIFLKGWYLNKANTVEVVFDEPNDKIVLRQKSNGVTLFKQKVKMPILTNTDYDIKVDFDGANFRLFINKDLSLVVPAVQAPSAGDFGIKVRNTTGSLRNFLISQEGI